MSGVSVLILMMLLSFAIDRVVRAILFLLSFVPFWKRIAPDPRQAENTKAEISAENRQKLIYAIMAVVLGALLAVVYSDIRLIENLRLVESLMANNQNTKPILDVIVTVMVLAGGADLLGRLLQISGIGGVGAGVPSGKTEPIEVTGKLILESSKSTNQQLHEN